LVEDEEMGRDLDLHGKVAVVTGAGSGIGRSTALLLARHGAAVHAADINAQSAEQVAHEIEAAGGTATPHALDVSDPAAVEALAEAMFASEGHVDILHNNAGIGFGGALVPRRDLVLTCQANDVRCTGGMRSFTPRAFEG
jgi:NAD(P)-dependent dehydrogenase (short-subunit alcohol dehydrogenase family)